MHVSIQALPATVNRRDALVDWILADLPPQAEVLEVGAGRGRWDYPRHIRESVRRLVGVDPDPGIHDNPYLHEHYQMTLEAFARCEIHQFNAIYAQMVLEHIKEPPNFASAVFSLLKPGGAFFSVTPNLAHYFGIASYLAKRLGIQERLLRRLRGEPMADSYHFAAVYRMNTVWSLRSLFQEVGAARLDFRMLESPPDFACYLPKPLKFIPYLHSSLVYALRLYPFMGTILFRALKSHQSH
jgi:SAM-dependent methyltransferase